MNNSFLRHKTPAPPRGRSKLRWYGPGLLWMLSAVGTGSILFTPRVASAYQYELLWLLLLVVFFMWVMIHEMARYSIVTGQSMLEGMHSLHGPRSWAVWLIFVPQLFAAAVGIAGLSAVVGSAVTGFLPGSVSSYGIGLVVLCTVFVSTGQYGKIEAVSRYMAMLLMAIVVVSAVVVGPDLAQAAQGLVPQWPDEPDLYIIMPWVGTILAGSMGIVWFGYWTATRGFGGGLVTRDPDDEKPDDSRAQQQQAEIEPQDENRVINRARDWVRVMAGAATLGVVGGMLVITCFMVLGAELLAPAGVLPEGSDVAVDLTNLFSDVWGAPGRYILLAAIIIALGGSVLANQDGWGRSFADMTLILLRHQRDSGKPGVVLRALLKLGAMLHLPMLERRYLKRLYVGTITGVIPVVILMVFSDPVVVMSASGIIAAIHTPFIALTALYVNLTRLPEPLRPGIMQSLAMGLAGLFYLGFATVYVWDLVTG